MQTYYNDNDRYCSEWLTNLVNDGRLPKGKVDARDIREIKAKEIESFTHAHFFAGIGGWALALEYAEWPKDRQVWTCSTPCQPFSSAGKKRGFEDERHLWPVFYRLIRECRPATIFGEQVASATQWLAQVKTDLEAVDYAVGVMPLEAVHIGAPHRRSRIYFVAHALDHGRAAVPLIKELAASIYSAAARTQRTIRSARPDRGSQRLPRLATEADKNGSPWLRESGLCQVADGVSDRVAKMRAFGNAIVPQLAAEFIKAASDVKGR
jgi:DNA (cytosine-5)-methyltransferase 1